MVVWFFLLYKEQFFKILFFHPSGFSHTLRISEKCKKVQKPSKIGCLKNVEGGKRNYIRVGLI